MLHFRECFPTTFASGSMPDAQSNFGRIATVISSSWTSKSLQFLADNAESLFFHVSLELWEMNSRYLPGNQSPSCVFKFVWHSPFQLQQLIPQRQNWNHSTHKSWCSSTWKVVEQSPGRNYNQGYSTTEKSKSVAGVWIYSQLRRCRTKQAQAPGPQAPGPNDLTTGPWPRAVRTLATRPQASGPRPNTSGLAPHAHGTWQNAKCPRHQAPKLRCQVEVTWLTAIRPLDSVIKIVGLNILYFTSTRSHLWIHPYSHRCPPRLHP